MNTFEPYQAPDLRFQIDLDLSRNEGRSPGPEELLQAADLIEGVNRYPDPGALRLRLAHLREVNPDNILVTAGADDALLRSISALTAPGTTLVCTTPTFEMIPRYAIQNRTRLVEIEWFGGSFPTEDLVSASVPGAVAVVVSPNNPTGRVLTPDDLDRLASTFAFVVLDGAYIEFADLDLTPTVLDLSNVVMLRTLSKAWGLAGLRVGYAIGNVELIRRLGAYGNPYPVSRFSIAMAVSQLGSGRAATDDYLGAVGFERERLRETLSSLGVETIPSQANFILATTKRATFLADGLGSLGIATRTYPTNPGLQDVIRITLPGNEAQFDRLTTAIETVLCPQGLIFDLDGVLADVTESLAECIKLTAAQFGVTVDILEIDQLKAAGNASDDWELTRRILESGGVTVDLAKVVEVFQAIYHGTTILPGLKLSERNLVDPATLAQWAARYPLAVVTGRPRSDAIEFLDNSRLLPHISTLVTRDDAAMKPDPAPLLLAMATLGVDRAWLIGDNRDDVDAARRAGVMPIGVTPPGRTAREVEAHFASAALVLNTTNQLMEVLP